MSNASTDRGALVKLSESLMVSPTEIRLVNRCGCYTDVTLTNGQFYQLWDEDMVIWNAIEKAAL